jgi:hypothetical protein
MEPSMELSSITHQRDEKEKSMSTLKRSALILALIVLTACSASPASLLAANRKKWEAQHITHYRFKLTVTYDRYTPPDIMPVTIEAQNGQIVSMVGRQGQPPPSDYLGFFQQYAIVERLFDKIDQAYIQAAEQVHVEYNAAYGYPELINLDPTKVTGDESTVRLSNFEVLK